jgi:F420-0:gamma-glutamyl ligase
MVGGQVNALVFIKYYQDPSHIEKLLPNAHHAEETLRRYVVKTISYGVAILILDFGSIYLFTGQIKVALGFMIVSNIYTTVGFFSRENLG